MGKKLPLLAMAGVGVKALEIYQAPHNAAEMKWRLLAVDINGKFSWPQFVKEWLPVMVGVGGSMAASKLGVNKMISSIPYVKM